MTVNELKKILSAYPDNAEVRVDTIDDAFIFTGTVTYEFGTTIHNATLILEAL